MDLEVAGRQRGYATGCELLALLGFGFDDAGDLKVDSVAFTEGSRIPMNLPPQPIRNLPEVAAAQRTPTTIPQEVNPVDEDYIPLEPVQPLPESVQVARPLYPIPQELAEPLRVQVLRRSVEGDRRPFSRLPESDQSQRVHPEPVRARIDRGKKPVSFSSSTFFTILFFRFHDLLFHMNFDLV